MLLPRKRRRRHKVEDGGKDNSDGMRKRRGMLRAKVAVEKTRDKVGKWK